MCRNLIFRMSIVFNIAVYLYAAVYYSGNSVKGVEWLPITSDDFDREAEFRYLNKVKVSTLKKTVTSTASNVEMKISAVATEANIINKNRKVDDESVLSESTLTLLRAMLGCKDKDYRPEMMQRSEFWVLKNYVRASHGTIACHETITYTTHGSFEFLDNLIPLLERWMAPVSLAIHAPGSDMMSTVNSIRYLRDCVGNDLVLQYATFHIFFSNKHIPINIPNPDIFLKTPFKCTDTPPYVVNSSKTYRQKKNLRYPINVGRNIARSAALTHFVLPSDIELYPSPDLAPKFLNMIARNGVPLCTSNNPRVFPINTFEVDKKYFPPTTKKELQIMLKNKTAIPFHKYVCPTCHNLPNGKEWMAAPEKRYMGVFHVAKRQGKHSHWEPFFIGTDEEPYYDERLSWEGKNDKRIQAYILCVKDYDFMVLDNAFLVHKPGIKYDRKNEKRDRSVLKQSSYIERVILPELKKLFGVKHGCVL